MSCTHFQCAGKPSFLFIFSYVVPGQVLLFFHGQLSQQFLGDAQKRLLMECNRDEALRAKEIAEKKLAAQDYHGALKFLQKALALFPGLENTSQISAVLDVHIAAQTKINGTETDWYGILQVDSGTDDIVVKKQYKKLALLLHPDKNKYAGAEAAFKLIGEALQVLSDKHQRMLYDARRKRNAQGGNTTHRTQSRQSTNHTFVNRPATHSNTFITVCPACHTRYQYYRVYENQNLLCHQCRIPFLAREYLPTNGTYSAYGWQHFSQAQTGFNPSSFQPFASATNFASYTAEGVHGGAQKVGVPGGVPTTDFVNQQMEEAAQGLKRKRKDEKELEKEMRRVEKEQQKKAKADQRAQEAMEKEMAKKRRHAEKASGKEKNRRKRRVSDSSEDDDNDNETDEDLSEEEILNQVVDSEAAPRRSSRPRRNVTYKVDVSDDEEVSPENGVAQNAKQDPKKTSEEKVENTKISDGESAEKQRLAELFKFKIRVNLGKSTAIVKDDKKDYGKSNALGQMQPEGQSGLEDGMKKVVPDMKPEPGKDSIGAEANVVNKPEEAPMHAAGKDELEEEVEDDKNSGLDTEGDDGAGSEPEEVEEEEPEEFSVPDPEFHDFDAHRKEKDVKAGQIWASYDNVDGLPRYYFRVKEVQSRDPFRVNITWLELQNLTTEQQTLRKLGFWPTCGNSFKSTTYQVLDSVNTFSHILNWEKGPRGTVIIYPRKGDVWALYKNWKSGLRVKKKNVLLEYDMVEVLTDFSKQVGVSVAFLEKLPDHKTLFKRTGDQLKIPATELGRFSYQVPAYLLQEEEAPENATGCWELDPASVPLTDIFPGSGELKSR